MKVLSTVAKMETNYGTEEILICEEGLCVNDVIVDTYDTETPIETNECTDTGHTCITNKDDNNYAVSNGVEYGEDFAVVSKLKKHFGRCLELEFDEETMTIHSQPVENDADRLFGQLGNTDHFCGNLGPLNCGDESKFSEATSVINIVPIMNHDHISDSDIDEYDDCQLTSHTEGRNNSSKRIKLELSESDEDNRSIHNVTCDVVEKPSRSDTLSSIRVCRKPSDTPNYDHTSAKNSESPSGYCGKLARKTADVSGLQNVSGLQMSLVCKTYVSGLQNLCPVCQMPFTEPLRKSQEFSDHLKLHFPQLYLCQICGQGFTRKDNQERHAAFHKNHKVHYCHICGIRSSMIKSSGDFLKNAHMETHRITQLGVRSVPEFLSDYVKMNTKHVLSYTCNICGAAFVILSQLLTHLAGHSDGGRHSCIVCAKECIWEVSINMWMCKSHPDICNICGVENLKPENLDFHRKRHYGTFYNCEKCDQGFTQQENLDKHMFSNHSRPRNGHPCHLCHYVVLSDVDIQRHIDCHSRTTFNNGLPDYFTGQIKTLSRRSSLFACNLCSYFCDQVQPLISHLLEHVKSSYACPDCGKEYVSPDELKDHGAKRNCSADKHDQEPPVVKKGPVQRRQRQSRFEAFNACPLCEQQFFFFKNMEKHQDAVHFRKKMHPCHACDRWLSSKDLKPHINKVHRDSTVLTSTNGTNAIPKDLSSTIMTHSTGTQTSLVCSICGACHLNLDSILSHLQLHLTSKLACSFCGKEFVRRDDLLQHHSLHPFHMRVGHPVFAEHSYSKI